jgi:hypothetical protein
LGVKNTCFSPTLRKLGYIKKHGYNIKEYSICIPVN